MTKVAVVIPCFKVDQKLGKLVSEIEENIDLIILVDDACPDNSVKKVMAANKDQRVVAHYHEKNQGVGGAVVSGIKIALDAKADVVIKLDGDGQYSADLVNKVLEPIATGEADCAKGNRFFFIDDLLGMPPVRIFGNAVLSLINKLTSGYWNIMDPTNGLIAWRADVLSLLPLEKLDKRYFFESDILFRLNCLRAYVVDVPLRALYSDEVSSLSIAQVLMDFPKKYLNRIFKRLFYNYFVRDFNLGSLFLLMSFFSILIGILYGFPKWYLSAFEGVLAETGEVMAVSMLFSAGLLNLLAFLFFDVINQPSKKIGGLFNR